MHTIKNIVLSSMILCSPVFAAFAALPEQGIYINQGTMGKTDYLDYLIEQSKASGVSTFVIDYMGPSTGYYTNIERVNKSGIKYVARIVVFSDGGNSTQMHSQEYWQKQYRLVEKAMQLGAKEIQLDYIRYSSKQPASSQNTHDVHEVIKWFKQKIAAAGRPMQLDVFGMSSYREIKTIGQSIPVFSKSADAICPMNYPSHWEPYRKYSKEPYQTVYNAIHALREQFKGQERLPFKLYPYIELTNYRMPMSHPQTLKYIDAQLSAVEDGHADGWYAWSPKNKYNNLFTVLKERGTHPHAKKKNVP